MKSTQQLTGQKFNRLFVLECMGKDKKRNVIWKCKCDCGNIWVGRGSSLTSGETGSCGCYVKDSPKRLAALQKTGRANRTHGVSKTLTYSSWCMMIHRCYNPKRIGYQNYGGRGICACAFLKESALNLLSTIGERTAKSMSLERMNNSLGYWCGTCPECVGLERPLNVKWADRTVQAHNKRNNVWVEINGVKKLRHEWAKEMGVSISYIRTHYNDCESKND